MLSEEKRAAIKAHNLAVRALRNKSANYIQLKDKHLKKGKLASILTDKEFHTLLDLTSISF